MQPLQQVVEFVELVSHSNFLPHDHGLELLGYIQLLMRSAKLFDCHKLGAKNSIFP